MKRWQKWALGLIVVGVVLYSLRIFKLTPDDHWRLAGKGITLSEEEYYKTHNVYEYIYWKLR